MAKRSFGRGDALASSSGTDRSRAGVALLGFGAALYCAASSAVGAAPGAAAAAMADDGANWSSYGRTHDEQRYSPLAQIDRRNVGRLGLAWSLDLTDAISFNSSPLAVDGVLYFSGDRAIVRAVDARRGELLWTYDPQAWKHSPRGIAMAWNTNRGIAHLDGRIYVGTPDGRLVALDAKTGEPAWATRTFPVGDKRAITGPPRAFAGRVYVGHGGADFGARGYLDAYDAGTGERLWRFYTVPGDPAAGFENAAMEKAAKTWAGRWWQHGGGGTVWHAITYDPALDLVYLGVGNGSPWDYGRRSEGKGDNLFLSSIVAVRGATGEYVWHYQTTPGDEWDFTATQDIVLADLEIDGKPRRVLMQAPKNGFYYVIDRATGELLRAAPYDKVTWATHVDMRTGRPVEAKGVRLADVERFTIYPGPWGAHNWQAMSFSPRTGLAYIPTMTQAGTFARLPGWEGRDKFFYIGKIVEHAAKPEDSKGSLVAFDPVAGRERWRVDYDAVWNGGTLVTAGDLVFHGTAAGEFLAYDARNGRRLWGFDAQRGISSAPISYAVDGQQYVAVLVGWGGLAAFGSPAFNKYPWRYRGPGIRLLAFALDGRAQLPPKPAPEPQRITDTGTEPIDAKAAETGFLVYHTSSCATCHGGGAVSNGASGPDLRGSQLLTDYRAFRAVLVEGLLLPGGMPMFDDLTESEGRGVYEYLRQQARAAATAK